MEERMHEPEHTVPERTVEVTDVEEVHDIEREMQLVEEEQEMVISGGYTEDPRRSRLTVGLILAVSIAAIAFFIMITYLPGLFHN
jgi:hypothetical protein